MFNLETCNHKPRNSTRLERLSHVSKLRLFTTRGVNRRNPHRQCDGHSVRARLSTKLFLFDRCHSKRIIVLVRTCLVAKYSVVFLTLRMIPARVYSVYHAILKFGTFSSLQQETD